MTLERKEKGLLLSLKAANTTSPSRRWRGNSRERKRKRERELGRKLKVKTPIQRETATRFKAFGWVGDGDLGISLIFASLLETLRFNFLRLLKFCVLIFSVL